MNHICGIYYVTKPAEYQQQRNYLAQAEVSSHTQISRLYYTTQLKQVYSNPSKDTIQELRYTFPLYDGVSVGAYTIRYGDTTLTGKVKQKEEAKKTYDEAVARGETASLLDYLPAGIFAVTIGNLPPKTDVHVDISYSGELKHDAGVDGLRYTLPTSIAPRYGSYPGQIVETNATAPNIRITVDVDVGKSNIRKIQSPSHPIAVTTGNTSSNANSTDFQPSQGSATLTQGRTALGDDFVLQVVVDNIDAPQAVLEKHPTVDSRAIAASLVPRFTLPQGSPEIVFIADQSGSMMGSKNDELVAAMQVFLRSLPFGVRFNICAFGSNYKYLWAKSQAYNESNLKEATKWIKHFKASYGGTEMFEPVKQAFLRKHDHLPLEIVLLTDGEIWQEQQLFDLINTKIRDEKVDARVFTLGIGADVSHTLVEGVARAGNGFAQFITNNEGIDQKIVRSLKGCLYPHLKNYSIEVNFDDSAAKADDDDDFELVEKVGNQLHIDDPPAYDSTTEKEKDATSSTSFFDESAAKDAPNRKQGDGRYAHLPALQHPKVLQIPTSVPPLFPFNRSTVYFLLGPDAPKKNVASITLRAEGPSGPLALKVPVYTQPDPASTLHQLAARKAVQDLEEGRGWLHEAVTQDGYAVRKKHSSRFDELVEREAVRLGETFSVAGKWTSFVAVKDGRAHTSVDEAPALDLDEGAYDPTISDPSYSLSRRAPSGAFSRSMAAPAMLSSNMPGSMQIHACMAAPPPPAPARKAKMAGGATGGLFGSTAAVPSEDQGEKRRRSGGGLFRSARKMFGGGPASSAKAPPAAVWGATAPTGSNSFSSSEAESADLARPAAFLRDTSVDDDDDEEDDDDYKMDKVDEYSALGQQSAAQPGSKLRSIISCQSFNGSWQWTKMLSDLVQARGLDAKVDDKLATIVVLAFLEKHLAAQKDVWEMVADKARAWLATDASLSVDAAIADAKDKHV